MKHHSMKLFLLLVVILSLAATIPAFAQEEAGDPGWTWIMLDPVQTLTPGATVSFYGRINVFGDPIDSSADGIFISNLLSPSPYFTIINQNNSIGSLLDTAPGLLDGTSHDVWLFDVQANADAPYGTADLGSVTLRSNAFNEFNLNPDYQEGIFPLLGRQQTRTFNVGVVPEPGSLALMTVGGIPFAAMWYRRRKNRAAS